MSASIVPERTKASDWSRQRALNSYEIKQGAPMSEAPFLDPDVEEDFQSWCFKTYHPEMLNTIYSPHTIALITVYAMAYSIIFGLRLWTLCHIITCCWMVAVRMGLTSTSQRRQRVAFRIGPPGFISLQSTASLIWIASEQLCTRKYATQALDVSNVSTSDDCDATVLSSCCVFSPVLGTGKPWELVGAEKGQYLYMVWTLCLANVVTLFWFPLVQKTRPRSALKMLRLYSVALAALAASSGSWFFAVMVWSVVFAGSAFPANTAIIANYEMVVRKSFIDSRRKAQTIDEQSFHIRAGRAKIQRMQDQLMAAHALVARTMEDYQAALHNYELKHDDIYFGETATMLGEGSFGTVYKARLLSKDQEVAVKTMRVSKISERELGKFKSELIIMTPLHHENLVRLFGGAWNEGADKLCIVLEYCANGSLKSFLGPAELKLGEPHANNVPAAKTWEGLYHALALGAAKGLRYLHHELKEPLIHRDIKPANIMVSADLVAKLGDFGESKHFDKQLAKERNAQRRLMIAPPEQRGVSAGEPVEALSMTMVGTALYCAPEIMLQTPYNESVDTFSFALVLLCLGSGDIQYAERTCRGGSALLYGTGFRPPIPAVLERSGVAQLIREMWDGDFRARPAMSEVVLRLEDCAALDGLLARKLLVAVTAARRGPSYTLPSKDRTGDDKDVSSLEEEGAALRHKVTELEARVRMLSSTRSA